MLLNACKDLGFTVNTGKTKYMEVRPHRGWMANDHITVDSSSHVKAKTFKYLGFLLTGQNSVDEEIKCRSKGKNSCHYSVQIFLSSLEEFEN